jgi:hypothetical protein
VSRGVSPVVAVEASLNSCGLGVGGDVVVSLGESIDSLVTGAASEDECCGVVAEDTPRMRDRCGLGDVQ